MLQKNWKHVLPFALTTLVCMTSVARAETKTTTTTNPDSAHLRNLDNRVSALEQRKGAGGMINPQGRPQVRDGVDLFLYGNLLYWNAHENGLIVAQKEASERFTAVDLSGKWNWGFRAGVGYNTMHDGWDLRLTWLRFTDTGSHRPRTDAATRFHVDNPWGGGGVEYSALRGYWGLNLNQLDLDLGREFFVSKWLTLRPHMGLRTDWIHQNVNVALTSLSGNAASLVEKDRWWGIGIEGGLDTQWGLGGGWSVFGNMTGAVLYGLHEITGTSTAYAEFKNFYRISHPILDFQLGLRWDNMFYNDRFHLGLDLGWEHHVYFSQNQFPTSSNANANGDLTTQGWTFAARFDF